MGSFHFARRYFGNRCFFLFLRLLRCFSSPGSPRMAMDSPYADGAFLRRVSPFRYLRIIGYLLLPEAFRSLSRLSSALSAKASTLCSFLHNQLGFKGRAPSPPHMYSVTCVGSFGQFFTLFSSKCCNHYNSFLFITITSDVLLRYFILSFYFLYAVFKVHTCFLSAHSEFISSTMENTRFELVTSCLQGRRSPN